MTWKFRLFSALTACAFWLAWRSRSVAHVAGVVDRPTGGRTASGGRAGASSDRRTRRSVRQDDHLVAGAQVVEESRALHRRHAADHRLDVGQLQAVLLEAGRGETASACRSRLVARGAAEFGDAGVPERRSQISGISTPSRSRQTTCMGAPGQGLNRTSPAPAPGRTRGGARWSAALVSRGFRRHSAGAAGAEGMRGGDVVGCGPASSSFA